MSGSSTDGSPSLSALPESGAIVSLMHEKQDSKRASSLQTLYSSMTPESLREYFHLPLHSVAQKFGMCTTAFKKMCRRLGVAKWPHRQLRGIDKKIAALKAELQYSAAADKQQYLSGLNSLEVEKFRIASGLDGHAANPALHITVPMIHDDLTDQSQSDSSHGRSPSVSAKQDEREVHAGAGIMITEQMLRQHFHLPLHAAAERFGICTTALKKLCRRAGIAKWPHRQLKGIDKKIASLRTELNYASGDRHTCSQSIEALEAKKGMLSGLSTSPRPSPSLPPHMHTASTTSSPTAGGHERRQSMSPGPSAERVPPPLTYCQPPASPGRDAAPPSALDLLAAVAGEVTHQQCARPATCSSGSPSPAASKGLGTQRRQADEEDCRQARLSNLVHSGDSESTEPAAAAAPPPPPDVRILSAMAAAVGGDVMGGAGGAWSAMLLNFSFAAAGCQHVGMRGTGAGMGMGRRSESPMQGKCLYSSLPSIQQLRPVRAGGIEAEGAFRASMTTGPAE